MNSKNIYWFEEVGKEDTELVGGKGANLGEMTRAKFPVPPGFVVSAKAYREFLKSNALDKKFDRILKDLNVSRPTELEDASRQIKKLITTSPIPIEISQEIINNYLLLNKKGKKGLFTRDLPVAV
ncbi:phosphoenolpyruvate synthase, partial [Candidatus Gottesmanbacteria bacterium]|nr:phosphoenolpyruvate synthase [Candidatus Gottesmanbacteria bacterium]